MKKVIILTGKDGQAYAGLDGFVNDSSYSGITVELTRKSKKAVEEYNKRTGARYTSTPIISFNNFRYLSQALDLI